MLFRTEAWSGHAEAGRGGAGLQESGSAPGRGGPTGFQVLVPSPRERGRKSFSLLALGERDGDLLGRHYSLAVQLLARMHGRSSSQLSRLLRVSMR